MTSPLEQLRQYLRAWRGWMRAWRAPLGLPGAVPWLRVMPPTPAWSCEDTDGGVDGYIMRAINAEVDSLPVRKRAALRFIYLNEDLPCVFRSNRLTPNELRTLCAEAEVEMIPRLRGRGVVLGGT